MPSFSIRLIKGFGRAHDTYTPDQAVDSVASVVDVRAAKFHPSKLLTPPVQRLILDGMPERRGLVVLPTDPDQLVKRIVTHWKLAWDALMMLKSQWYGNLPLNQPLPIFELLKNEFRIRRLAAQSDLETLLHRSKDAGTINDLK